MSAFQTHPIFKSRLIPALVTPFTADGEALDLRAFEALARRLVKEGCDALLVAGTTGEGPTLSHHEKMALLNDLVRLKSELNVPILANAGSNDTRSSVLLAKEMVNAGADALLTVVPYYNKPTQEGILAHFQAIAESVPNTPIILYNIPGRVVVEMKPATMAVLHQRCPNVIGVKQSLGDMDTVTEIYRLLPKDTWRIWSGDDSLTLPMMACGAQGVISVAAHFAAPKLKCLVDSVLSGDYTCAQKCHEELFELNRAIFALPNPTLVKAALAQRGEMNAMLRLPLTQELPGTDALLSKVMASIPH